MAPDLTKRYVDEVLELSGVKKKGPERIREIYRMSDRQVELLVDDITNRAAKHYNKNLRSILQYLQEKEKGPKAYYVGLSPVDLDVGRSDQFIRKCCLYYSKIVTVDRLEELRELAPTYTPQSLKNNVATGLGSLALLWPWIEEGIVEIVPSTGIVGGLQEKVFYYAEEDHRDTGMWRSQVLRDEDLNLEGERLLKSYEDYIRERCSPRFLEKSGGIQAATLGVLAFGLSADMGQGFFNSFVTGSSPTTDRRRDWRLLGCWILRRGEHLLTQELGKERWGSLMEEVKASRAWLTLDAHELGVISNLPPKKIIEIRNSAEYSLRYFREDLGDAIDEIEGLKLEDEKAYHEAANQVWSKVREDARRVRRDLDVIRRKRDLAVDISFLSIILGLLPFPQAKIVAGLIGGVQGFDIISGLLEEQGQRKSTGYFLVKLEESSRALEGSAQQTM